MQEGVKLTYDQLKKVLEKHHIKEIVCEGEFDPEVHQATPVNKRELLHVLRCGTEAVEQSDPRRPGSTCK